jgi:hypothetical protein
MMPEEGAMVPVGPQLTTKLTLEITSFTIKCIFICTLFIVDKDRQQENKAM